MKTFSLTRRLISLLLLAQFGTTALLIAGVGVYDAITQFRAFDVMLRGRADSMLGAVQDSEDAHDNVMLDGTQTLVPEHDIYAVRDEFGKTLGHSQNWPAADDAFADVREFRAIRVGRRAYRLIRVTGLRMVDPGDKGGGIPRHVVILYGIRTRPVWERLENAALFYIVFGMLLLVVNGIVMLRFLRRGLKPLRELALQAGRISADAWEFDPSEEALAIEELNPLATALRTTLAGLERSFDQQRQFISDAAHELKTSVAVVKSSLQVLTLRERTTTDYVVGVQRAEIDCERMEQLVASMLFLAGLQAQADRPAPLSEVDLTDLILEVVEHLKTPAQVAEVRLVTEWETPMWVTGDREQLRVLCSNLIHNGIQHSGPDSEVHVVARVSEGRAEIRIVDTGEGIPPEALPHVFERFYRADRSRSRRTGGTGLGLAIAKAIAESSRGEISIASEVGNGTCVTLWLPLLFRA